MRFRDISLSTSVGKVLELSDPFWIASCHHTTNKAAITGWKEIAPAALTLKTSSKNPAPEAKKQVRFLLHPHVPRFGKSLYCDGPKNKELLTYQDTSDLLKHAVATLSTTRVGVSILSGAQEDYAEHRAVCNDAAFCELNLKYAFRPTGKDKTAFLTAAAGRFAGVLAEVERFCEAWKGAPVFVKLPNEMNWLPGTDELSQLLSILKKQGQAGVIAKNSTRIDIPPFVVDGEEQVLAGGVLCGDNLFDSTIALISGLKEPCAEKGIPIIASGGMISEQQILQALHAGASAIQLCTTFDYNRRSFYETLRSGLTARIYLQGQRTFALFLDRLRSSGIASLYAVPFVYFERFWSDDCQKHIQDDIRRSELMIVMAMSGHTLFERWKEVLETRFKANLGMTLALPRPDSGVFEAIQRAWGITEPKQIEARKTRITEAAAKYTKLWTETGVERAKLVTQGKTEATFEISYHDQCPFFACYIFDDNIYVTPYPLTRPEQLETPVYVFFRSTPEYERIANEFTRLWRLAQQTKIEEHKVE